MTNDSQSPSRGRSLAVGIIVIAAGVLVYLGVAGYLGGQQSSIPATPVVPTDQPVTWRNWDSSAFAIAQSNSRLIFLLVVDEHSSESRVVFDAIESNADLQAWLTSRLLPIRIDRRFRPDIADRYSEGAAPLALLLLPTGEGLSVLQGAPKDWLGAITEADRYWREHYDEVQERAEAFWAQSTRASVAPVAEPEINEDIAIIDSAVREFSVHILANPDSGFWLWRVDVTSYLRARAQSAEWADSILAAISLAREAHQDMLSDSTIFPGASAAPLFVDNLLNAEVRSDSSAPRAVRGAASRLASLPYESSTAAEAAAIARLNALLDSDADFNYPGAWLGNPDADYGVLPHCRTGPVDLDGYLGDALAWLEALLADASHKRQAVALGDSIWLNLWSPEAHALRDKPPANGHVRELENYPRAQLGRAAQLFYLLAAKTNDPVWAGRADTCLSAFAPYVRQAGPASAYYGVALLARSPFQ